MKSFSIFRQRGYQCPHCELTIMVYGNDPTPRLCRGEMAPNKLGDIPPHPETTWKQLWDHLVEESKVSIDTPAAIRKPA